MPRIQQNDVTIFLNLRVVDVQDTGPQFVSFPTVVSVDELAPKVRVVFLCDLIHRTTISSPWLRLQTFWSVVLVGFTLAHTILIGASSELPDSERSDIKMNGSLVKSS